MKNILKTNNINTVGEVQNVKHCKLSIATETLFEQCYMSW